MYLVFKVLRFSDSGGGTGRLRVMWCKPLILKKENFFEKKKRKNKKNAKRAILSPFLCRDGNLYVFGYKNVL